MFNGQRAASRAGTHLIAPQNAAGLIWLAGWLGIAVEWRSPRLIVPGVCGIAALIGSSFYLLSRSPEPRTAFGVILAAAFLLVEAAWAARLAAGIVGTAFLVYVFCWIFGHSLGMAQAVALPAAVLPGAFLTFAAVQGRAGRRAKHSDCNCIAKQSQVFGAR